MTQQHGLEIGSLDVVTNMAAVEGYKIRVLGRDANFGSAQAVVREIVSMLADGDLATYDRAGNRVATFDLEITAPDGLALALGEKALRAELYKPNTVTWTPPSDFAPVSVYEVVTSEMSQSFDALDEIRTRRIMRVTLTCAPFARSADLTTVEALVAGTTTVSVDTCDATTGWTGTRGGEPYGVGTTDGSVYVFELSTSEGFPPEVWTMTRTGTIDVSTTPHLTVVTRTLSSSTLVEAFAGDSVSATQMAPLAIRKIASSRVEYVYAVPAGVTSLDAITFRHTSISDGNVWQGFHIYDISRTDIPPSETARQLTRIIEAGGTERTPSSIHLAAPDGITPLGLSIVHTCPEDGSGYSPPQRRWRTFGNTATPDSSTFSGFTEPLNPNHVVSVTPSESLPPGAYLLAAMIYPSLAGSARIEVLTSTIPEGAPSKVQEVGFTTTVQLPTANVWQFAGLGILTLPSLRMSSGSVEVAIRNVDATLIPVAIDEWWLFRVGDDCALTVVESERPSVWLDSPNLASPVPTVWEGDTEALRTHPGTGVLAMGSHVLTPEGTAMFIATSEVDYAEAAATFYRRWHSNAAE